jgi:hypothetical protein
MIEFLIFSQKEDKEGVSERVRGGCCGGLSLVLPAGACPPLVRVGAQASNSTGPHPGGGGGLWIG